MRPNRLFQEARTITVPLLRLLRRKREIWIELVILYNGSVEQRSERCTSKIKFASNHSEIRLQQPTLPL